MEKQHRLTDSDKILLVDTYTSTTKTCTELAKQFNVSCVAIIGLLKRRGIVIRNDQSILQRKHAINEHFFDVIDSERKAYFLGLLFADGYNNTRNNNVTITLQEKDVDILIKLKNELESEHPISYIKYESEKHQNQHSFSFGSKRLSERLAELGCVSNKSLTLKYPTQVKNELTRHFIRGYFDGDGSIYVSKKTLRKGLKPDPQATFTSSIPFCKKLKDVIAHETGLLFAMKKERVNHEMSASIVICGRLQVVKFLKYMYGNSTVHMKRKYDKYLSITTV